MALVEDHRTDSSDGIKKTIDSGSLGMALDILQRGLYAFPIPSTIRELASNAYDAVKEREVAKSIINGKSKVEDHFDVTKTGGIYHSSGWDPTYFDLSWLSEDMDSYIYYDEGSQRDTLRIVDNGVGLGKNRLKNYFMLNWSSKRSNKDVLGRWGLGSKVALSLGISSFRVISRYNGKLYKFDVYLDKVDSIVPKFDSDGNINESIVLVEEVRDDDGNITTPEYLAYSEHTKEKNGVEVQVEIKKHNKKLVFEAVESQLMYLPHIKFGFKSEHDIQYTFKNIVAQILYRDKDVVISQSSIYNKPHILLGTGDALINYGYVSFRDLELEDKTGSVGLILDINDIEVTPSRESAVWSPKTRDAVLAKYNKVTSHAIELINDSLSTEHDYIEWVSKAYSIIVSIRSGISTPGNAISQLACIINKDEINDIRYPSDPSVKFSTLTKDMMDEGLVVRSISYSTSGKAITRKTIPSLSLFSKPVYFSDTMADPLKDRYIYETEGEFMLIQHKTGSFLGKRDKYILGSCKIKQYSSVVIPDAILAIYANDADQMKEEDEGEATRQVVLSNEHAKFRKANKMITVHYSSGVNGCDSSSYFSYTARDTYINSLYGEFPDDMLVYYPSGDRTILSTVLAHLPCTAICTGSSYTYDGVEQIFHDSTLLIPKKQVRGILVSQENLKYIEDIPTYIPLEKFVVKLYNTSDKKIIFGDYIKMAATLECINSLFNRYINMSRYKTVGRNFVFNGLPENLKCIYTYASVREDCIVPPFKFECDTEFLGLAYRYSLGRIGIIPMTDYELTDTLKLINASVPDYLCDTIDEIKDIDLLYCDFILDILKHLQSVTNADAILFALDSSSIYNNDICESVTKQINPIILSLNP